MEIKKGSSRIAICGENLTLKVPYFPPSRLGRIPGELRFNWKLNKWRGLVDFFTDPDDWLCFQKMFMDGFLANVREALWSKHLGKSVVPTHLSIGGLINVQSTAENTELDVATVRNAIKEEIQTRITDAHTFLSHKNYGRHDGQIKLLDYGARGVREFIDQHRNAFRKALIKLSDKKCEN